MRCYQRRSKNTCFHPLPWKRYMDELKQQQKDKGLNESLNEEEKEEEEEEARQTLTHAHTGVSPFVLAAPPYLPCILPYAGQTLGHVCPLNEIWNGSSHALIRKGHQGICGGKQRARATAMLYGKYGNKKTKQKSKQKPKTTEKQKMRSSKPIVLHSSLCTVHSVLTRYCL